MRSKEQNTSIINSLRATTEALLEGMDLHGTVEEKEEQGSRSRKKGVGPTKTSSRRGSISGVVAEAAKKFLAPAKEKSEKTSTGGDIPKKRPTLKGRDTALSHDLPEVEEQGEESPSSPATTQEKSDSGATSGSGAGSGAPGGAPGSSLPVHTTAASSVSPTQAAGTSGTPHGTVSHVHIPDIRGWWEDFESPASFWAGSESNLSSDE